MSKTKFSISTLAVAILSSSHLVLTAFSVGVEKSWLTTHRSSEETEEIANQNKTSIMQLPGAGGWERVRLCPCPCDVT